MMMVDEHNKKLKTRTIEPQVQMYWVLSFKKRVLQHVGGRRWASRQIETQDRTARLSISTACSNTKRKHTTSTPGKLLVWELMKHERSTQKGQQEVCRRGGASAVYLCQHLGAGN